MRTLVGRMVLVTIAALTMSGILSFVLFNNERGASVRRALETAMADEIVHAYDRIKAAPPEERDALASSLRGFGIAYALQATPTVETNQPTGSLRQLVRSLTERVGDAEVRVSSEIVEIPAHIWRENRDYRLSVNDVIPTPPPRGPDDTVLRLTDVKMAISLGDQWVNARFLAPSSDKAPLSATLIVIITVVVIGAGAAFVARQVARPLSDLANAASALGAGETNVSAPVHGPEDVRRASIAFNAMADRLGRQLSRQRQMLWALSHDLRTPITALRLRAELIEDDATRQRLLAPIVEMETLTEQALSLARAGASDEARVRVDIAEIARTLCGELQDMDISITVDAPSPVMIECRPNEIARAMRNLAENAAKYGGGGVMRVYQGPEQDCIVAVVDTGPGVPEDMLSRIAEPFFRADAARSGVDGAGLGLSIAQAIADRHGGKLELTNRNPRGFSAKLILPSVNAI